MIRALGYYLIHDVKYRAAGKFSRDSNIIATLLDTIKRHMTPRLLDRSTDPRLVRLAAESLVGESEIPQQVWRQLLGVQVGPALPDETPQAGQQPPSQGR